MSLGSVSFWVFLVPWTVFSWTFFLEQRESRHREDSAEVALALAVLVQQLLELLLQLRLAQGRHDVAERARAGSSCANWTIL